MDGTLHVVEDRFELRFERRFDQPVDRVWRAVTEPTELAFWFPGTVEIDLRVGGPATFGHPGFEVDPDLLPTTGRVTELDPPRRFAFTWGDDLLCFELTPVDEGCALVFTHRFANRASALRSAAGWHVCLDLLDRRLTGDATPPGAWIDYYNRYAARYGTDGTFTEEGGTGIIRFERVVERPATDVWAALTRPERLGAWLADATFEAAEGGRVELHFAPPVGSVVTGTVTRFDAPGTLEYTWNGPAEPPGLVLWQLIPAGDRCIVLFTHRVHGDWDPAGTLAAWHIHLDFLGAALDGQPTRPFPQGRWQELQRHYGETRSPVV